MSKTGKLSAGLLMFRMQRGEVEVLLVHPGGPFWMNKDVGAWSIPKGEHELQEDPLAAARREFHEEIGCEPKSDELIPLGHAKQKSGKLIEAWAFEGDIDPGKVRSNTFAREWPPHSGRMQEFPEIDRASWFELAEARQRIAPGQVVFVERLERIIHASNQEQQGPESSRE